MVLFELILGIVVVVSCVGILNNFIAFKNKSTENIDGLSERIHKLEELEERIKILETIITDQNYDLDQKIKSL
ncbi:MAG: hypothetical protein COA74_05270 [Gammaproteobacteria bacterium]|nr:MAG: hypothetical protein COA74_05270 [Gammaproteobacteria bacterium]